MHTKKGRDRDQLNNIRGGGGFVASADAIYVLSQERRGGDNCTLFCTGREIESVEITLKFDSECMRWLVVNDPANKPTKDSKVLGAVYLYIRAHKLFVGSATELIEKLKSVSDDVFYPNRITRELHEQGNRLVKYGIIYATTRNHNGRIIILQYFGNDMESDSNVTKALANRSKLSI